MRKTRIKKQLVLNKTSIAKLNVDILEKLNAGCCPRCCPARTDDCWTIILAKCTHYLCTVVDPGCY